MSQAEEWGSMTFFYTLVAEMATISLKSLHAAIAKIDVGLSVHEANRSSGAVIRFTILLPCYLGEPYKDGTHLGLGVAGQSGGWLSWWSLASAFHVGSCS